MASSMVSAFTAASSTSYTSNPPRVTTLVNTHSSSLSCPPQSSSSLPRRVLRISEDRKRFVIQAAEKMSIITEKLGVKIQKNPPESKLTELGVRNWPKWGCPPSKFPWTYESKETCYLLKGKVKVYPEGAGSEAVEFGAGDLVEFPKGMSCTWDVSEAVDKHYKFE